MTGGTAQVLACWESVGSRLILCGLCGVEVATSPMILYRVSHRPTFRKNYLNPALAQGVIEMTVPDKPNSRNQMYRRKQLCR